MDRSKQDVSAIEQRTIAEYRPAQSALVPKPHNSLVLRPEHLEIISELINKYGKQHQILVAIEEMIELSKALIKHTNRGENTENIINELADVVWMCHQLIHIFTTYEVINTKTKMVANKCQTKLLNSKSKIAWLREQIQLRLTKKGKVNDR